MRAPSIVLLLAIFSGGPACGDDGAGGPGPAVHVGGPDDLPGTDGGVERGCGEFDFQVAPGPPTDLLLVVDRSGSMSFDMPEGGSKWDAMLSALDAVTHDFQGRVDLGLSTFPAPGAEDACAAGEVLVPPALDTADAILTRLVADGFRGGTPTAATLTTLAGFAGAPRAGHEGHPTAILLTTDGGPGCNRGLDRATCTCMLPPDPTGACANVENCLDADGAYAALDALRALVPPVPVYVVGLPGTESFTDVLSEMARRGGTARAEAPAYYDARSVEGLSEALSAIAASTVSCTFDLDLAPVNPREVRVTVDGAEVPHSTDGADGWDYADPDHTSVELLGSACALVRDGVAHEVGAAYACEILF